MVNRHFPIIFINVVKITVLILRHSSVSYSQWQCFFFISAFDEHGNFQITPYYDAQTLEQLFRHKLLKMLLKKGAITQWHIDLLMSWHHSGFNVHVCEPIAADDRNALESLAHYIIRCQFSQERMTYFEQMVRYYGYYSNAARGKRRKLGLIDAIARFLPTIQGHVFYRPGLFLPEA